MALKWKPYMKADSDKRSEQQNSIVAGFSDGTIIQYLMPLGKIVSTTVEEDNEVYCLDISDDYTKMVTGGRDG